MALILIFSVGATALATEEPVLALAMIESPLDSGYFFYETKEETYYIALEDMEYESINVSSEGIVSAEHVEFDPEIMEISGLNLTYCITKKGEVMANYTGMTYEEASEYARMLNDMEKVTYYEVVCEQNPDVIKVTLEKNYSSEHKSGSFTVEAVANGIKYKAKNTIILDVVCFEPEQVKWASSRFDKKASLQCGEYGYSDYLYALGGYDDCKEPEFEMRTVENAAVVTSEEFRMIAGESLSVVCNIDASVVLKMNNIAEEQEGINFKAYNNYLIDKDGDGVYDAYSFGFYGDGVILSDYVISVDTGYTLGELREAFGVESNEATFYVVKEGEKIKGFTVDYTTEDLEAQLIINLEDSGSALGEYEIICESVTEEEFERGDVNCDGKINVIDANLIRRYAAKLIDSFPTENK